MSVLDNSELSVLSRCHGCISVLLIRSTNFYLPLDWSDMATAFPSNSFTWLSKLLLFSLRGSLQPLSFYLQSNFNFEVVFITLSLLYLKHRIRERLRVIFWLISKVASDCFYYQSFHEHWQYTGLQGKAGGHLYPSLPLPPAYELSDILLIYKRFASILLFPGLQHASYLKFFCFEIMNSRSFLQITLPSFFFIVKPQTKNVCIGLYAIIFTRNDVEFYQQE